LSQGWPTATLATQSAVEAEQKAPATQLDPAALQSSPIGNGGDAAGAAGAQAPVQHPGVPLQPVTTSRLQPAETHSSGCVQGSPSASVPLKMCAHDGSFGTACCAVVVQATPTRLVAAKQVAAAAPS
jgi:hypothetical protein